MHENTLRRLAAYFVLGISVVIAGCGKDLDPPPSNAGPRAAATLDSILEAAWQLRLDASPQTRLQEGLPVESLPQLTYAAAEERALFYQSALDRLASIDASELTAEQQVTLETIRWEARMAVEGHRYFWLESRLTPYANVLRLYGQLFPRLPLGGEEDLARFVALVEQVPAHVRQLDDLARGQFERDIVLSQQNLEASTRVVRVQAAEPAAGPFRLEVERVARLDPELVAEARARIERVVVDSINPAVAGLVEFLEGSYADRAPAAVGIAQYPDGRAYYEYLTRLHTTMDVEPEQVQQAGRELLTDFQTRMAEIRDRLGWQGTAEEFHEHLKTDPGYFPATAEEVGDRLRDASTRMTGHVSKYFVSVPEAPWDAQRLAPELEPAMTYGYYSPATSTDPRGYYYYNGSNLDERSWLGLTAISLHELIPGHHFQISRQLENERLPDYRRNPSFTAYVEGWGSYASFLGLEAGVYEDLYSEYGLYILESFLATRLVVDPGMNYFDMTLEAARQFMRENTLESETQIATESLRYSTDIPGQALGYQMGKRALLDLRARSEAALEDRFDIHQFHEVLLRNGSVPMVVLDGQVEAWIEAWIETESRP